MSSSHRRPDGPASKPKGFKASKKRGGGAGGGGGGGESPNPNSIHDYSEAFEAGVEAEEKGERFAISFKAMRRYQEAAGLYLRAMQLRPDSAADAAYNAARVHYLLATSFYPPPLSIETLQRSISLYRQALLHAPPPSLVDAERGIMLDQAFSLDVRYNLGVALQSLGELLDDVSTGQKARETLVQAVETLQQTAEGQEKVLEYQRTMTMGAGQDLPLADSNAQASGSGVQDDAEMETAQDGGDEDDDSAPSDFVASVVTPASALESLTSLHATLLSLLSNTTTTSLSPAPDEILSLASQSRARGQNIVELYPDGDASNEDERLEWADAKHELRLAVLNAGILEASKRAELASESGAVWPAVGSQEETLLRALEEDVIRQATLELESPTTTTAGAGASSSTAAIEASAKHHMQLLCDLADGLFSLAKLRIRQYQASLHLSSSAPATELSALTSKAWDLAARSSKLYLAALSALSNAPGSSAPTLSISTASTSTPTTRAKSSINVSLSHLSLFRSSNPFISSSPKIGEKVVGTLRDNALVYAKRSLGEVGLGWMYEEAATTKGKALVDGKALPHGGWESLRGEADAMLSLCRAAFKKGSAAPGGEAGGGVEMALLKRLTSAARGLVRRKDAFATALVGEAPFGDVWLAALDLRRFAGREAGGAGESEHRPLLRLLEEVDDGLGGAGLWSAAAGQQQVATGLGEEWSTEVNFWEKWVQEIAAATGGETARG